MTRSYVAIGLVGVALIIAGTGGGERGLCSAKETKTARRTPGIVAVLDVARLFKDSKQFKAEMEKMKGDVTKAETKVKAEREKLKSQREELEKLPAGSDERMKQEEEQNKLEAALEASVALQKKTFITREARVYLDSYKRMEAEVAAYAKQQGIDTVIRVAEQTADISNATDPFSRTSTVPSSGSRRRPTLPLQSKPGSTARRLPAKMSPLARTRTSLTMTSSG